MRGFATLLTTTHPNLPMTLFPAVARPNCLNSTSIDATFLNGFAFLPWMRPLDYFFVIRSGSTAT